MIMNSDSRTARISSSQDRMHGYLAEFVLIDGTAKVVGDFGSSMRTLPLRGSQKMYQDYPETKVRMVLP